MTLHRLRDWRFPLLLSLPALLAACIGNIGDKDGGRGADGDDDDGHIGTETSAFTCDTSLTPEALPLRRLSKLQYTNTVRDLLAFAVPGDADVVFAALEDRIAKVPDDLREGPADKLGGFTRIDQTVHQEHIDTTYDVAVAAGAELSAPGRIEVAVGACAGDGDAGNDDACLDDMIRRFGARALRAPLTDEDVAFYRAVAGAPPFEPADYADVFAMLMTSPQMLYFVEHGDAAADHGAELYELGPFELASRLSYHFWQTMPDDELFSAAESGELATVAGWTVQVERLFADPRTRGAVDAFFGEWLHRDDLEELDSRLGTPVYDAFVGDYVPGPDLREHMLQEVTDMARWYVDRAGTFEDLLTSRQSFATTDDLAEIYGVPAWDGQGEPTEFADADRIGLITRASMVATGSSNTRPIMKGAFIRKVLLCDSIPPPPNNAAASPPPLSGAYTTREVVEQLTEQKGTACAGCHPSVINPLGFATESFDALGRFREVQPLYDPDTGELLDERPVDTTSIPQIIPGDPTPSAGAADVQRLMVESEKPQACFARHYFRFTFARAEDVEKDGCALAELHAATLAGGSLAEVLRAIALQPAFRERAFEGGEP